MRDPFSTKLSDSCYWALGNGVKLMHLEINFLQGLDTGFSRHGSRGCQERLSPGPRAARLGWGCGERTGRWGWDSDGAEGLGWGSGIQWSCGARTGRRLRPVAPQRPAARGRGPGSALRGCLSPPMGACSVNHGGNISLAS